jgi:hypothetical protein
MKTYATIAAFEAGEAANDCRPIGLFLGASLVLSVAVFLSTTPQNARQIVLVTLA